MSRSALLDCYRVPIYRTGLHRLLTISAYSADDARERATEMAEDLLRKRLPWLMENGVTRPPRDEVLPIVIGEPELMHRRGFHK